MFIRTLPNRRSLAMAGLLLSTAAAPIAAGAATPDYCPEDGPVHFGVEPYEAPETLLPAYQQIGEMLARQIGCDVKIDITSSYTAEIEAMRHGKLDVGEFGPFGVVLAQKVAGARIIAQFGDAAGKPRTYWASIVSWKGSGITKLSQVAGQTFVYSDPASTSGHLMPAYALKRAGIDPDKGIRAFYAGTHTNSFEALRHHKGKAGEFNSETQAMAKRRGWLADTDFVTLWRSKPLPLDAVAVSPRIDQRLRQRITQALTHMTFGPHLDASARKVMGEKARLIPANDATYAYIRQVMKKMDITLQDL